MLSSSLILRLAMPIAAHVRDDAWPGVDWSTTTATTPFSFPVPLGFFGLLARAVALGDLEVTLCLHQEMGGSALLGSCCSSATFWLHRRRWAPEHFRLLPLFDDSVASPGDGRLSTSGSCCSLATLWLHQVMGGVALQAPAALWQLCGFHRDRLAPAALCRPGGFTRRGTAVRFLLLLLFGNCGFTRWVFYVLQASVTHQ